jgi:DNA-directed RNA polymerase specialized sigma24 family protein
VQSAKYGNTAALERLSELNLGRVFTLALRLASNVKEAELLCSKVFVSASKKIKSIGPETSFANWITLLTIQGSLSEKDENNSKRKSWLRRNEIDESEADNIVLEPIQSALAELKWEERFSLVLNIIEGYAPARIALFLGNTRDEVESNIESAFKKILNSNYPASNQEELEKSLFLLPREIELKSNVIKGIQDRIYETKVKEAEAIEAELEEEAKKKEKLEEEFNIKEKKPRKEKKRKSPEEKSALRNKIYFIASTIVLAILVVYLLTLGGTSWKVMPVSGVSKIEDGTLFTSSNISAGEILETAEESHANIIIDDIGKLEIGSQTKITCLTEENSAKLSKGKLTADLSDAKEFFRLEIPSAIISDLYLGTYYKVEVNEWKNSNITVQEGWLVITSKETETILPANYGIEVQEVKGCGIPYHSSASEEFIDLLNQYIFRSRETVISKIVETAGLKDAISLWNIFSRVKPEFRKIVYNKLNELAPHPEAVDKESLMKLEKESMQKWLDEIEWLL